MASAWGVEENVDCGIHVLKLQGELDLSVAPELERHIVASLSRATDAVHLDLTEVTYLDSSSVRALLRAADAASEDGKSLRVTGASGVSRRVLELAGVDQLLGLGNDE